MRTVHRSFPAAVASLCLLSAANVRAQVAVGAALGASFQAAGASDRPYLGPGFGGTSLAGLGTVDVAIGPHAAVGGELSTASAISGAQSERTSFFGSNAVISEHRDTVVSGVLKFGSGSGQRVRAAGVIGGGFAERHTERTGTFVQPFSGLPPSPVHETLSDVVLAFTGGVDVSIGVSEHVAVLAIGRLYHLIDNDRQTDGVVHRGVSSTLFRYGGGVQIRF